MWFAQTDLETTTQMVTMTNDEATSILGLAFGVFVWSMIWLVISIIAIIALWRIFSKAGEAGWKAIIPIYNYYVLLKIVGRPGWWLLLLLIPFVNIIVYLLVSVDLAKSFGKSEVFGVVAIWLFSIIGYMILGFGESKYVGPASGDSASTASA